MIHRPPYSQGVTLFWLVYTPLLLGAVAFFGWSLYRYVRSRWSADEQKKHEISVYSGAVSAELIALQAQFIVAPRLAREEAIALLLKRSGTDAAVEGQTGCLPDDFESLLDLVSRTRPIVPARQR